MTFEEYQSKAVTTDVFGGKAQPITSLAFLEKLLGLVGEAGEVADKFKKIYRDDNGVLLEEKREMMEKELGDVLWYVSVLASYLNVSLDAIAIKNLEKLQDRKARKVLKGSGDNR
jgi:NTP pyrophosphatase (non-canonical NTP hydrolase)